MSDRVKRVREIDAERAEIATRLRQLEFERWQIWNTLSTAEEREAIGLTFESDPHEDVTAVVQTP